MCEKILPKWNNSYVSKKDQQNFLPQILNLVGIPTVIAHVTSRTHTIFWISYDRFKYVASPSLPSKLTSTITLPPFLKRQVWHYSSAPSHRKVQSSCLHQVYSQFFRSCLIMLPYDQAVPVLGTAAAVSPSSHFHDRKTLPCIVCQNVHVNLNVPIHDWFHPQDQCPNWQLYFHHLYNSSIDQHYSVISEKKI